MVGRLKITGERMRGKQDKAGHQNIKLIPKLQSRYFLTLVIESWMKVKRQYLAENQSQNSSWVFKKISNTKGKHKGIW